MILFWLFIITIWCKHVHRLEDEIPVFFISDMHVRNKKYGNYVSISRLTGKCAPQKLNLHISNLWTCLHHMIIFKTENKKTPHCCMLLAWGGGPRVVVSTAAFHARVRGSVPGPGGLKETKNVSSPSTCESQYCGEPQWPRGSVLGLRPPGLEFRIMCLEDSVISIISPSPGCSPRPV